MVANEILVDIANKSYDNNPQNINADWEILNIKDKNITTNPETGFAAVAYRNKNSGEIVIAYRGTDIKEAADLQNDISIAIGKTPKQYQDAILFYDEVAKKYGKGNIILTGHSLGGALAQLVGAETGATTVTYNAPGVVHLLPEIGINSSASPSSYSNITNYNIANDILNILNIADGLVQLGSSYIIPSTNGTPIEAHLDFQSLRKSDFEEFYIWYFKNQKLCSAIRKLEKTQLRNNFIDFLNTVNNIINEYNIYQLGINDNVKNPFNTAQSVEHVIDPVILDLNGDGIKTTKVSDGVYFDHEGDGFRENSSWVDENDGVLVIDKNNNGYIDNGTEVFGNNYVKNNGVKATNGFDALKDLDSNNDGKITSADSEFSNIKVLKGNGELVSLSDLGITTINLNSVNKNTKDENGNTLVSQGTFVKEDGTVGNLGDFNLVVDKMNSFAVEWLDESEEIAALPEVLGMGLVHSLHQTMVRDESGALKRLVEDFVAATGSVAKKDILEQILYKWAGADKVADGSRGEYFDAKKLFVLEKFIGEKFKGVNNSGKPNNQAANFLSNSYNSLLNNIYSSLQAQTGLKGVFDLVEIKIDEETNTCRYSLNKVQEYIDNKILEDETAGKELLGDFTNCFVSLGLKDNSNYQEYYDHFVALGEEYDILLKTVGKAIINGTEGDDHIEGTSMYEAIFGGGGDDTIYSRQGDDLIYGGEGNDSIDACEGNDIIYGGAGNDTITGGSGHDLIYGGDGDDVLDPGELGSDTIYGGTGNDTIERNGASHGEDWYFDGGDGEDYIEGGLGRNTLIGGRGNDTIIARGTDVVYGGDGNDSIETSSSSYINGGEGNDTINFLGYTENPTIEGARGDDYINVTMGTYPSSGTKIQTTFVYNLGDGNDTITSALSYIKSFEFGEGITRENIRFTPSYPRDVLITFEGHEGSIFVTGLAGGSSTNIEGFLKFADGTSWSWWDILVRLKIEGTDGDDSISGSGASEKIYGYDGNDTINGNNGPDTIYGGNGNDSISANGTIYGEDGDDTIRPNGGNYYVDGGNGNDSIIVDSYGTNSTIVGGKGDDFISVSKNYWASSSAQTKILYKYNLGDGNDTIQSSQATNTIEFGEGIREEDVIFRTEDRDIVICFKNHEGSIRVKNGIYDNCKINNYVYTDKNTVSEAANDAAMGIEYAPDFNVNKIIQDMAAYNTTEDAMISYDNDINQEKELMTLVNSSM